MQKGGARWRFLTKMINIDINNLDKNSYGCLLGFFFIYLLAAAPLAS